VYVCATPFQRVSSRRRRRLSRVYAVQFSTRTPFARPNSLMFRDDGCSDARAWAAIIKSDAPSSARALLNWQALDASHEIR